eukprot:CAMPEP_0179025874 /NCGR_PEP_ID=MMETSP0796-20121207/8218_1 /TAXON_ID=73915 /ORGANISM="Pyrodinium bahamense, Strain pbaha01" /LENGTH=275 /DNA_ID=CAMNT_0020721925 /DNA_START=30 /DNA_END=857 /DNA_ORIENTATION=-
MDYVLLTIVMARIWSYQLPSVILAAASLFLGMPAPSMQGHGGDTLQIARHSSLRDGTVRSEETFARHLSTNPKGWEILNVESNFSDVARGRYAYFDDTTSPGYSFLHDVAVHVQQYREGVLIWEGDALTWKNTEAMVGDCLSCTARIRRVVHSPGQWELGDMIVVPKFHATFSLARIAFLCVAAFGVLSCEIYAAVSCVLRRRRRAQEADAAIQPNGSEGPETHLPPPEGQEAASQHPPPTPAVDFTVAGDAERMPADELVEDTQEDCKGCICNC